MVGGLARTLQYGEFKTDCGPHRFFSRDQYLLNLIENLLKEKWTKVKRITTFYLNGKYLFYPIKMGNVLLNVGPHKAFMVLFDYLFEKIKGKFVKKDLRSFQDYIICNFGKTLAELYMTNYTNKIWGLNCSEISIDWARQRIKDLSLGRILREVFIKPRTNLKTMVDRFYYPYEGGGLIYEIIKDRIINDNNGAIMLNSRPLKIMHNNTQVDEVIVNFAGNIQALRPQHLISSMPITELVSILEPQAPNEISDAVKNLRFRSHVSFFITLDRPYVFREQWIYFPDKGIPFGRIMEPRNFSKKMSPTGKTSLLIEFFCWENDRIWNATKKVLMDISLPWLEKLGFIRKEEIIDAFIHREKYAYPVYDLKYKVYLEKIYGYLRQIKNLQLIGRGGCFRYNNQDQALETGILGARNIIEGKQYN